jgi:hypothetical protein
MPDLGQQAVGIETALGYAAKTDRGPVQIFRSRTAGGDTPGSTLGARGGCNRDLARDHRGV